MKLRWSSGRVVKWSSGRASGFFARSLVHWATGSLCLCLLLAACEVSPSEQFAPQLVVHGFITAKGSGVLTNINRTYAIDDPFDTVFADVSAAIWRGHDTWPLVHDVRDIYNTRQIFPSPSYGDTFGMRVAGDGFDTVYGRTVVPDSFRILFPSSGDTVTMSDSMVWTRSRNCAGYYMSLQSVDQGDTFYYSLAIPNDTTGNNFDSLRFTFPQMVFLYQFKPGNHTLRVYALDTNYFDWVRAGGFGLGSGTGETTHLSGGLGVFGSMVAESVKVVVRMDTARAQRGDEVVKWSSGRVAGLRDSALGHWIAGSLCLLPLAADGEPFRDCGQQLLTLDRLGDERIGPGFARGLDILLAGAPGQNQDRSSERLVAPEH
jgi:hypothetical protein